MAQSSQSSPPIKPHQVERVFHNLAVGAQNLISQLPGEKPQWVVLELEGSFPARTGRRKPLELLARLGQLEASQELLEKQLHALAQAPWLKGVVFRFGELQLDLSTAYALRRLWRILSEAGKRVSVYASQFDLPLYFLATAADEIIMPPSAEAFVNGLAFRFTFMRDALARFGLAFDGLAIEAYKNASDPLRRQSMSDAQREQYEALLHSLEATLFEEIAGARKVTPETVKGWFDEGVTSAEQLHQFGIIDRVAYEDEVLGEAHKMLPESARFLRGKPIPLKRKRVALISLKGTIIPGKSRRAPLPLPIVERFAGSESLQRAFRAAEADEDTEAIVFYVNSGGGSALASDLIWRELARIKKSKPVVAVMGAVAASGGYYVLTHANTIIAAPTTVTGSIGVLVGKFVFEGFNERYGFNPETLTHQRYTRVFDSSRGFDEQERGYLERYMHEVYDRFVARVAEGRALTREQVHEIGRGRIWSGQDALGVGLVDALGDIPVALAKAKELAGLPEDTPVWNVEIPSKVLLPKENAAAAWLRTLGALRAERGWLVSPLLLGSELGG